MITPCKRCGSLERSKSGHCKPCKTKNHKEWRRANQQKLREYRREWRKKNSQKERDRHNRWYRENREEILATRRKKWHQKPKESRRKDSRRVREWRRKYPEKARVQKQRRRAFKHAAGGTITTQEWTDLLRHYGEKCLGCGRDDAKLTMDHIVPLAKGGHHTINNVQPLCGSCNSSKGTKTIDYRPDSGAKRWTQPTLL